MASVVAGTVVTFAAAVVALKGKKIMHTCWILRNGNRQCDVFMLKSILNSVQKKLHLDVL